MLVRGGFFSFQPGVEHQSLDHFLDAAVRFSGFWEVVGKDMLLGLRDGLSLVFARGNSKISAVVLGQSCLLGFRASESFLVGFVSSFGSRSCFCYLC